MRTNEAVVSVPRILAANLLYLAATVAVLVAGLSIWTKSHLTLRLFGPDTAVFLGVFVVLGVPAFLAAAGLSRTVLRSLASWRRHLASVAVLYVLVMLVLARIVLHPPLAGIAGGDIALRVVLAVATLGIAIDLAVTFWRKAA